jgi:hypothetical protein
LASISSRYFSTRRTLVISREKHAVVSDGRISDNFTSNVSGTVDFLTTVYEELHKSESWNLVTSTTPTNRQAIDWHPYHKHSSYILLVPRDSDHVVHIVQSVEEQLKRLSGDPGWNPRAQFVVAVASICRTCDAEKLAQRILEEMWKQKVDNAIILVPQNHDTGDSGTGNKLVKTYPELELYAWFPYRDPNQCSRIDKAVLLDIWLMKGEGMFYRNYSLFPKKIYSNLHGCKLRVSTIPTTFSVRTMAENIWSNTNVTYEDGWEIRLINVITETMNMKMTFLPPTPNFRQIKNEFGNFTGYTAHLLFDQADIAFGAIVRSKNSPTVMDVTRGYQQSKWEWYVPCPLKYPRWKSIFRMFSASLWLTIFLSTLLANFTIVFLAKFENVENESFKSFINAITDVWAVIIGVSVSVLPRTTPLRLFFFSWICYSLAIGTVFQAYFTTFLTDPGFEKSITSLEELISSGIKYGYTPYPFDQIFDYDTSLYFKTILQNRVHCPTVSVCLSWTAKYRNFSTISSKVIANYFYFKSHTSADYAGHTSCTVKESAVLFTDVIMLLQKGSPLLDRVNEIIGRVLEGGIIDYWVQNCAEIREVIKAEANATKTLADEFRGLTMKHMQSAFYLLFFGQGLSMISFITEVIYFKCFFNSKF